MSKTDVSFRPKDPSHDVNPNYVPPASVNRQRKMAMKVVWHNCKTCPPTELFNESLVVTDGANLYHVRWDQEVGYFGNHCMIEVSMNGSESWWWADLYQTTTEFFQKMK